MIARIWHGAVPIALAGAYERYVTETGVRSARGTPGNRGVLVLRHDEGARTDFLFTSFWESAAAVRRFAGPQPERAVYYPRDPEFLLELEPCVTHYEVIEAPAPDLSTHFARILRPLG